MEAPKIKGFIKPIAVVTVAFFVTMLVVGMIAYTNCNEAKVFIDNMMGNLEVVDTIQQA